MSRTNVTEKVLELLVRLGAVDVARIGAEIKGVSDQTILRDSPLVNAQGKVALHVLWMLEQLLTMALGGQPRGALPQDVSAIRDSLILFLKLNRTDRFHFQADDTSESWTVRILDALMAETGADRRLDDRDRLVLYRVTQNGQWRQGLRFALQLYVTAYGQGAGFFQKVDGPAVQLSAKTFKRSVVQRQARIPKAKYGDPMTSFRDIAEYAVGQYLVGADVNEALSQTLVQAQLGTTGDEGRRKFEEFLAKNRITPDMFPTTVQELFGLVARSLRFKETEAEIVNALYAYAKQVGQEQHMAGMFSNFVEPAFPVAAKLNTHISFSGLSLADGSAFLVRWLDQSALLAGMRDLDHRGETQIVLAGISRDELRHLNAFRTGRTTSGDLSKQTVTNYVATRTQLLQLNALNEKLQRAESALTEQMQRTENFIARPGKEYLKDVTFGVDEFFRALKAVFGDIFEIADESRKSQVRHLDEFNRTYGPLTTVSLLVPRPPQISTGQWITMAREKLGEIPYHLFEGQGGGS